MTRQDSQHDARRRTLLGLGTALAGATLLPAARARAAVRSAQGGPFPKGFLWGAAIAGHQAEGDNVASDA